MMSPSAAYLLGQCPCALQSQTLSVHQGGTTHVFLLYFSSSGICWVSLLCPHSAHHCHCSVSSLRRQESEVKRSVQETWPQILKSSWFKAGVRGTNSSSLHFVALGKTRHKITNILFMSFAQGSRWYRICSYQMTHSEQVSLCAFTYLFRFGQEWAGMMKESFSCHFMRKSSQMLIQETKLYLKATSYKLAFSYNAEVSFTVSVSSSYLASYSKQNNMRKLAQIMNVYSVNTVLFNSIKFLKINYIPAVLIIIKDQLLLQITE